MGGQNWAGRNRKRQDAKQVPMVVVWIKRKILGKGVIILFKCFNGGALFLNE